MKQVFAFACVLASVATAGASCPEGWSVKATSSPAHMLNLSFHEVGRKGPGCDLVVRDLHYMAGIRTLSVGLSAAQACPLDSIREREAHVSWQRPFGLRGKGSLRLVVNGADAGSVSLDQDQVTVEGDCR